MEHKHTGLTQRLTWLPEVDDDNYFANDDGFNLSVIGDPISGQWGWEIGYCRYALGTVTEVQIAYGWKPTKAEAQWAAIRSYSRFMVAGDAEIWTEHEHYGKDPDYPLPNWWKVRNGE